MLNNKKKNNFKINPKHIAFLVFLIALILIVALCSLTMGEYEITPIKALKATVGIGDAGDINFIWNVRMPRIVVAICIGATLSLSGLFTKIALKNPLADSGVLGIQTGATTISLLVILVFPVAFSLLPLLAFFGGLIAFLVVIGISYSPKYGLKSTNVILSGVVVNSFFGAIIGIITIFNRNRLQDTLAYLNGSLANISANVMIIVFIYAVIAILLAFLFVPVLKILLLSDITITNLGKNPVTYRLATTFFAVFLASITASYVGVISFIGILVPNIIAMIVKTNIKMQMVYSLLLGGLVVLFCDFVQRITFAPQEVPVGIIIGLASAPIYLIVLKRNSQGI